MDQSLDTQMFWIFIHVGQSESSAGPADPRVFSVFSMDADAGFSESETFTLSPSGESIFHAWKEENSSYDENLLLVHELCRAIFSGSARSALEARLALIPPGSSLQIVLNLADGMETLPWPDAHSLELVGEAEQGRLASEILAVSYSPDFANTSPSGQKFRVIFSKPNPILGKIFMAASTGFMFQVVKPPGWWVNYSGLPTGYQMPVIGGHVFSGGNAPRFPEPDTTIRDRRQRPNTGEQGIPGQPIDRPDLSQPPLDASSPISYAEPPEPILGAEDQPPEERHETHAEPPGSDGPPVSGDAPHWGGAVPQQGEGELREENIRLDVATPPVVTTNKYFQMAAAIRQPDSGLLNEIGLSNITSRSGHVFYEADEETIEYELRVSAPDCDMPESKFTLELRPGEDSEPCYFLLRPRVAGEVLINVTAFQKGKQAAATRLSLQAKLEAVVESLDSEEEQFGRLERNRAVEKKLYALLKSQYFTLFDMEELCFDLDVDWENIRGEEKREKALCLVNYFANEQRIHDLIQALRIKRPDLEFPEVTAP